MINRREFLLFSGFIAIGFNKIVMAESSGFEEYKRQQLGLFQNYVTEQEEAFELYKKSYIDALNDYKVSIAQNWDETEISTAKKWVSYSKDYQQKMTVDYESATVTVSQVITKAQDEKTIESGLKRKLINVKNLSYQQAYLEDPIAQKVDKNLVEKVSPKLFKQVKPSLKPVVLLATTPNKKELKTSKSESKHGQLVSVTYKIKKQDVNKNIKRFLPEVMKAANKEEIPPQLILAVIKNESSFNPLARSHIPAYGLMQIVPTSAGKDASKYLYGEIKVLSSSYLYTPDKNIVVGAAYLHILNYRYLKRIKHPESRLYCVIAAYNTGSGNVARAFTGNRSIAKAVVIINKKTPAEVLEDLQQKLPYDETKRYLKKVLKSYRNYGSLFEGNAVTT